MPLHAAGTWHASAGNKEYMEHRSPENYATLLTKENAVIEQQIRALKEKQKWIQRQQKRIKTSLTINPDIIEEVSLPGFYIAAHPVSSSVIRPSP